MIFQFISLVLFILYIRSCNSNVNVFKDAREFTEIKNLKTNKENIKTFKVNKDYIIKMVNDELQELREAKTPAEEIDALIDAMYYIAQHLAETGYKCEEVWKLVHKANMTKFEKGYLNSDGKWCKDSSFIPPDDDIATELRNQRIIYQIGNM